MSEAIDDKTLMVDDAEIAAAAAKAEAEKIAPAGDQAAADKKAADEKAAEEAAAAGKSEADKEAEAKVKAEADEKAKEAKDAKGDKAEGAPEEYGGFKLPDGQEIDADALEVFLPAAKEANLTQDQAQGFVDIMAKAVADAAQDQLETWETTRADWRKAAESDKEVGGERFEATLGLAKKALNKIGTPELSEQLDITGMGDHVEVIRLLARVAKIIGDDELNIGGVAGGSPKTQAEVMFPDMPTG